MNFNYSLRHPRRHAVATRTADAQRAIPCAHRSNQFDLERRRHYRVRRADGRCRGQRMGSRPQHRSGDGGLGDARRLAVRAILYPDRGPAIRQLRRMSAPDELDIICERLCTIPCDFCSDRLPAIVICGIHVCSHRAKYSDGFCIWMAKLIVNASTD